MKRIFKYLLILIFGILTFVSCSNNMFDSDEVFITLNCYNNIDEEVVQVSYSLDLENNQHDSLTLDYFDFDAEKEGYIFFGGYSEKNGQGKQYITLNKTINIKFSSFVSRIKYWNYDVYLHYEAINTSGSTQVTYNLPEDTYVDGELETTLIGGKDYVYPVCYLDGHYFDFWTYKVVYENFTSQEFTLSSNFTWNSRYANIVIEPSFYTLENNYYVSDAEDFLDIKNHPSGNIFVVNDIDLSGINYVPFEFNGTLEGNDHIIKNANIVTTDTNAGLFTHNSGKVTNLNIIDINITSNNTKTSYIGALCGTSSGEIIGVSVAGTITSEMGVVGGIVGKQTGAQIISCYSNVTINSGNDGNSYVGGIVGRIENSKLEWCFADGNINAPSTTVGGVIGSSLNTPMYMCQNEGDITATGSEVGGIIGKVEGSSKLERFINKGNITGCNSIGGIIGVLDKSNLIDAQNYGEINGYDDVGGIIGKMTSSYDGQRSLNLLTNEGKIISVGSNVGGILGNLDNDGSIFIFADLINKASVEAKGNQVGGIIGRFRNYIGYNDENVRVHQITNCKNEGNVTGNSNVGGFNGYMYLTASNPYGRHPGVKIEMDNIINTGDVLGENYVGGLIGNGISQDGKGSFIKNSTSSSKVEGKHTIGGIAGYINYITVDTCSNENSIIKATGSLVTEIGEYARVGGYCGVGSEIKNCTNELDITYDGEGSYIGGIVGETNGNLSSCINKGNITALNAKLVGGVAGFINVNREYSASSLTNEGAVKGKASVGGIIGNFNQQMTGIKDNDVHTSTFDNLINYGDVYVESQYAGVIASIYGDAANEYLRYPTVKVVVTNIENYGDIYVSKVEAMSSVGGLVGFMQTDSEASYIMYYKVSTKINDALVNKDTIIGYNVNASFSEGEYIPK